MSVIRLSDVLAAEENRKVDESRSVFKEQLPEFVLDDVSLCCNSSVDYSLGVGNPTCSNCGKPVYS
ncbi:MAG: hypothetical protein ABH840_03360 [Nanoarchaeota archaeon]